MEVGNYGHLRANPSANLILDIKDGARTERDVLMVELSTVFLAADAEFRTLLVSDHAN